MNMPFDILKKIMEKILWFWYTQYSGGDNVCCSKGLNVINQYINYVQFPNHLQEAVFETQWLLGIILKFTLRMKMNINGHWEALGRWKYSVNYNECEWQISDKTGPVLIHAVLMYHKIEHHQLLYYCSLIIHSYNKRAQNFKITG